MGRRKNNVSDNIEKGAQDKHLEISSSAAANEDGLESFVKLGVRRDIFGILRDKFITTPTAIQSVAIPLIREHKDVVVLAKRGSGKTFAYLISIYENLWHIFASRYSSTSISAIIILPTLELCNQTSKELAPFLKLFGETPKVTVLEKNSKNALRLIGNSDIVMSTLDFAESCLQAVGPRRRQQLRCLIIDEVNLLLSKSNEMHRLLDLLPKSCQCLLFSDDPAGDVRRLQRLVPKNPYVVTSSQARGLRVQCLPYNVEQFYSELRAAVVHHGLDDDVRVKIIEEFNGAQLDQLIVVVDDNETDGDKWSNWESFVVAEIDFNNVDCVVNFDLPRTATGYARRVNRTGRAHTIGVSLSLVSPEEMGILNAIRLMLDDHDSKIITPYLESVKLMRKTHPSFEVDLLLDNHQEIPKTIISHAREVFPRLLLTNNPRNYVEQWNHQGIHYESSFSGKDVSLKMVPKTTCFDDIRKMYENLRSLPEHPSLPVTYSLEEDSRFWYFVVEHAQCTMLDLVHIGHPGRRRKECSSKVDPIIKNTIFWDLEGEYPLLPLFKLLKEVFAAVICLISRQRLPKQVHLEDILVFVCDNEIHAKLWPAGANLEVRGDSHNDGFFRDLFFKVVTGGLTYQDDLSAIKKFPEAEDFIGVLMKFGTSIPELTIQRYPIFWDTEWSLFFFSQLRSKLSTSSRKGHSDMLISLGSNMEDVLGGNSWMDIVPLEKRKELEFVHGLKNKRRYKYGILEDLVRLIRNAFHHPEEENLQLIVGEHGAKFDTIRRRFPKLLSGLYYFAMTNQFFRTGDFNEKFYSRVNTPI